MMKLIIVSALIPVLACSGLIAQQPSDEANKQGITRQQADDILLELRAIHELLDRQVRTSPPIQPSGPSYPTKGTLKLDGEPSRGSDTAPVTIVEFTDYECPFCRQFEKTTLPELLRKYVDTGKVRIVVHDFPLNIHVKAMPAAEAAHCAGVQGKFWPMHDSLFSQPGDLSTADLVARAGAMKLNVNNFRKCLATGAQRGEIDKQMKTASNLQIVATPSFLIGRTASDVVDGAIITGAQPLSAFEAKILEIGSSR
ncbi:MAG TPA: thioredoxin domain-containing protein [Bryobacteraceae bacterium]|nr:thioredoxin domain-containing protein [Bryobacteraceae bacterium]